MALQEKLSAFRQEMRLYDIPLYPPDVNASCAKFRVEDGAMGTGVRYALAAIKGVGGAAVEALEAERDANGPFADAFDLAGRMGPRWLNKRLLESLTRAGAFDRLHACRRQVVEAADVVMRHAAASAAGSEDDNQVSLFGDAMPSTPPRPNLPECEEWPTLERLQMEFDVLGLYLSAHPLDGYAGALARLNITSGDRIRQIAATGEGGRLKLAGIVTAKQERVTEKTRLARVVLSDATAQYEVTIFAELLSQCRDLLDGHQPLYVEADARLDADFLRLTAFKVQRLDDLPELARGAVEIRLASPSAALRLKPLLAKPARGGGSRVRLVVALDGSATVAGEEAVVTLPDAYQLGSGQRVDVERMEGVVGVRDVALH
jgi:DNA polymerase-3 subunit alpha